VVCLAMGRMFISVCALGCRQPPKTVVKTSSGDG